ncbi:N-acylhomoserine lactone synthase [Stakelama sediminis]|uniref:Acyl-homoserine-lactone synthase n=1 Tax=Stakelama sediminis TaxID=463200 RepID=A0A840Z1B0_9SPHN|nr:acyl-homoserine-lactone synthase [Stakelama sediminis]MBB5719921.1 acyl-homoserine lactone synthase [Stakelama sediminis]
MLHELRFGTETMPQGALAAMFAARKRVFVDLLGWNLPIRAGRFEIDQFDGALARYLILTDPDGSHLGSARLLPTTHGHLLDTLYPDLCDAPPPRGPQCWEISRFCLDRRLRAGQRRIVRDTLVLSLVNYALAHAITRYTALADLGWYRKIADFGWRCTALGAPCTRDGVPLVAFSIRIDAETPALLARRGIRPGLPLRGADSAAA